MKNKTLYLLIFGLLFADQIYANIPGLHFSFVVNESFSIESNSPIEKSVIMYTGYSKNIVTKPDLIYPNLNESEIEFENWMSDLSTFNQKESKKLFLGEKNSKSVEVNLELEDWMLNVEEWTLF